MSYTLREGTEHRNGDVGLPVLGVGLDGAYHPLRQAGEPDTFSADEVHVPADDTDAVLSFAAAGPGAVHVLTGIVLSYSGTPTGGRLTIADGSETVLDLDIVAGGPLMVPFNPPRKGRSNRTMTITLAAGGAGVVGKLNVLGHWTEPQPLTGELNFSDESESGLIPILF